VSGEERVGDALLERYGPLCANVPRREKKRHSHALRDCTRDEAGAIQNLPAPIVRRALSSIVSLRSTIFRRSPGRKQPSHAYLRLRSTFQPADSQNHRGDHDQDPRLHFSDRFCDHLTNCFRADRRHARSVSAAQRPRSEPRHIRRPHRCSYQSQTGPTQPLRQAGRFIKRGAASQLNRGRDGGQSRLTCEVARLSNP